MPIPRNLRRDFFKKWTPEMAYVLGFFAADGNMIRNKRGAHFVAFYSCDRVLLENVRHAMGSNHKIGRRPKRASWRQAYQLQLGSKQIFDDLRSLGMTPSKSNTLQLPKIPSSLFAHFVRGYFDGDGCVYFKRLKFADRKRPRQIFMTLFTCGSRIFLEQLHAHLKEHGIRGGSIRIKTRGYDLELSFRDSLALYRLMYNTGRATVLFLPRKFRTFNKAIRALYPDAAVV